VVCEPFIRDHIGMCGGWSVDAPEAAKGGGKQAIRADIYMRKGVNVALVDVTVTSATTKTAIAAGSARETGVTAKRAEEGKLKHYGGHVNEPHKILVLAVETRGRIGNASLRTLETLASAVYSNEDAKTKRGALIAEMRDAISMALFRAMGRSMRAFRAAMRNLGKYTAVSKNPAAWKAGVVYGLPAEGGAGAGAGSGV